ncbi:MAG: hypothetical protein PVJ73_09615 [Acidobacteriota bacterium]
MTRNGGPMTVGLLALGLVAGAASAGAGTFPREKLPPHITPLTDVGQRAEWSLDGTRVLFLTRAGGEVREVDVETGEERPITERFERPEGWGFYRVMCLANGDYLLTGGPARKEAYLQILDKSLTRPPVVLDEVIAEGPAVSRTRMKIAWTRKQDKIWTADLVYEDGVPRLANRKLVIDNSRVEVDGVRYEGMVEPQSFRPPEENELIWAQYGSTGAGIFTSEVMGVNLGTGKIVNYSRAPNQYDEPEGIFPDGRHTLIECDHHNPKGTSQIELYRLRLDGTGQDSVRLTHFSDVEGFRASNPVVRDDGRLIAFQESRSDSPPGSGDGLYLLDLERLPDPAR